jgi:uncharacterized YccA/Bax inhibitor family protein
MNLAQLQSSNPVLANDDAFGRFYGAMAGERPTTVTLQGVVNKTAILVGVAVLTGAGGYAVAGVFPSAVLVSWIVALIVAIGIFFKLRGNPMHAVYLAPVYAAVQGFFLGALTGMLDGWLAALGYAAGNLALQAFTITIAVTLAMLGLYYARILQPTRKFAAVVSTLTVGIMITYALSMVLWLFGISMPLIDLGAAMGGGTSAWIGLGLNLLILGVASMWLIIDFGLVEEKIQQGAPRQIEWYCAFALIVTLAWIYYEALKLAFRLALMFGNRD